MSAPMSEILVLLVTAIIGFISVWADEEFEGGSRTLILEHSFDSGLNPSFTRKGTVVIRSVKGHKAYFSQSAPLTDDEQYKLKGLAQTQDIYKVRMTTGNVGGEDEYVTTFTPASFFLKTVHLIADIFVWNLYWIEGTQDFHKEDLVDLIIRSQKVGNCGILESNLSDHIWIHFDQSGEVMGISMETYPSLCQGEDRPSSSLEDWNTSVEISQTVQGPIPDTQSYIEKLKREEQERAKGQQGDNRSFLAKYWMYIVPVVLVMMLAGGGEQQQGGGGR